VPDIYNTSKRSRIMSAISGKETTQEIMVRKYLFSLGFRYRKNDTRYPGKPDILLPKYNKVVFIHGCFWHGHKCQFTSIPKTNKEFWANKIENTIKRDNKIYNALSNLGWEVIVVWQCELKNRILRGERFSKLKSEIINR